MKILVTGAAGHLGAAVVAEFARGHDVVPLARADLDITDAGAVNAAVERTRPDAVVNCAAFNDVDAAEAQPVLAFQINAMAVRALARAAAAAKAIFIHFSSDFVFDGRSDRPYTESDPPGPLSVYGASKLVGDWFAEDAGRWYVLRVESVFGGPTAGTSARSGSVGRIIEAIEGGIDVPVFVDRTVSPSYAIDIARVARTIAEREIPYGLYHCVNSGSSRWDEIAREVARLLGRAAKLKPMTLEGVSLKAVRPRYCALSTEKLVDAGIAMQPWQQALRTYLETRASGTERPSALAP